MILSSTFRKMTRDIWKLQRVSQFSYLFLIPKRANKNENEVYRVEYDRQSHIEY